ncbi:phage tail tube protein [Sagittula sp. S175]|uniref:phage tail tube protein n=1 Tax=Sagittula sp. S175 TaxID=3415129 RepID=UPI003C7BC127
MAKYWRKKVLMTGIETTYGTPVAIGSCTAVQAKNVSFNPAEGSDKDLAHETSRLGNSATLPVDQHATLTFQTDLVGSGAAGTAPALAPLLRAVGMAETVTASTSVVYNPISDALESATFWLNVDNILYLFAGSRGTAKLVANASSEPILEWSFTSLFSIPTDAAPVTPNLSAWLKPKAVTQANTPTFTIGGTPLYLRSFTLDLACAVEPRFLANKTEIMITDRAEMIQAQIEAEALATFNPWAMAEAQAEPALVLQHEATAGRIITIDVPACQMLRPGAPTEAQGIKELPLNMKPMPVTGNDQFTLTFT